MKVAFDRNFHKKLSRITDKAVLSKVKQAILQVEGADDILQIRNIKKLVGFKNYYRIKLGDYRIGLEYINDTLTFITIAHRKDIYKKFP